MIEALGRCLVEQPDLVILGQPSPWEGVPEPGETGDSTFLAQLRRYCPDSRTLAVTTSPEAGHADPPLLEHDGSVAVGDASGLLEAAAKLCGIASGRRG